MKVFGLIGEKLSHSLSPIIHRKIYTHIDIDATYSLFQVNPKDLESAITGMKALDINGCNVTIPYKIDTMEYLSTVSPEAASIGAINTIKNNNGNLIGYNTDYMGFGRLLEYYSIEFKNKPIVILGNGGASKAVTAYLADNGAADLYVVSRTEAPSQAAHKAKYQLITYQDLVAAELGGLLINCTPVGMYPTIDAAPVSGETAARFDCIVDLIYNPSETLLMRNAKVLGTPAYNGLYMLVAQAVSAVEIWNDIHINKDIVTKIFLELQSDIKTE